MIGISNIHGNVFFIVWHYFLALVSYFSRTNRLGAYFQCCLLSYLTCFYHLVVVIIAVNFQFTKSSSPATSNTNAFCPIVKQVTIMLFSLKWILKYFIFKHLSAWNISVLWSLFSLLCVLLHLLSAKMFVDKFGIE